MKTSAWHLLPVLMIVLCMSCTDDSTDYKPAEKPDVEVPDTSEKPDTPEEPDVPAEPENPDVPAEPENPDIPAGGDDEPAGASEINEYIKTEDLWQ